jgi:alpha-N-arabinofuranosidase
LKKVKCRKNLMHASENFKPWYMIKSFSLFLVLLLLASTKSIGQKDNPVTVNQLVVVANHPGAFISKDIYGHFSEHLGACIYGGIWVGTESKIPNTYGIRNDVLFALRELKVPNLRWPGGCFADTYHWKDGIGPKSNRASIVNTYWGGVTEDNSFGTHEFMKLTELIGCDAYINGNVGSGTVREMAEWVEYLTSGSDSPMTRLRKENGREEPWKVGLFAIGNENWGCGGNMTAEFYGNVMRQFSTNLNNYSGNQLYRVACGPNGTDVQWTETLMKDPAKTKGLIVDEWGNWFSVEPGTNPGFLYQQNTMRDAVTAAIHLNIFNQHADRVKGANIAQIVNVLQSVILTKDDKMVLTPTYHVFRMFNVHQNARLLNIDLTCEDYTNGDRSIPSVTASASVDNEGKVHISMANLNPNRQITVTCPIIGESYRKVTGELLTSPEMNSFNSFGIPDAVKPVIFNGFTLKDGILTVSMPSKSVVVLELTK